MAAAEATVNRVTRLLGVRVEERRSLGLMLGVFALGEAGRSFGMNASDALFFVRFGVDQLPWMYVLLGGLTFLAILGYAAGLARYRWRLLHPLYLVLALFLILERLLIPLGHPAIYPVLWLSVQVFAWVLVTAGWSLASATFDTRQAKRLFSLLASASILGSMLGHAATGWLADAIGTENLYLVYALLLLISYQAVRSHTATLADGQPVPREETNPFGDMLAGVRALRRSPLLRLIAVSSILFSILFFSMWFPFSKIVSSTFADEAALAGFLGRFTSVVMFSTLLLSLVSGKIFSRIGVVNVILLVPLIYLAGFGLWSLQFTLTTAIAIRFAQLVWINGAGWTAWNALFNVFHSGQRQQLRAFESGVPSQIGTSLSGLLLLLGEQAMTTQQIFLLGGSAALFLGFVCWRMRFAYGEALLDAIRGGLVDVFTGSRLDLGHGSADSQARESVVAALRDESPAVRRIAANLLARIGPGDPEPLLQSLHDDSAEVRTAAVEALGETGEVEVTSAIKPLLVDPSPQVRRAAVGALGALEGIGNGWVEGALRDGSPEVRAEAVAQLAAHGQREAGRQTLIELIDSGEEAAILTALEVSLREAITLPLEHLTSLSEAGSAQVRQAALRAATADEPQQVWNFLLRGLSDPDERVREAAASLARGADLQQSRLFKRLEKGSSSEQRAILMALALKTKEERERLITWTLEALQELESLRMWGACLKQACRGNSQGELMFLCDLVQRRREQQTENILGALRRLGSEASIRPVERGLRSESRELQTQALEALETLGEPRIVRGFIPLLEEEPEVERLPSIDRVLHSLSDDRDPWMRAFALRLRGERLRGQLHRLESLVRADGSEIVLDVWGAWAEFEGGKMTRTLDTLSTMERVLLLRKVPIFDDLDPDDLQRIAEIVGERVIPEGEYLCREGEPEDDLFLIVEGNVIITKEHQGRAKELRRLGPGQPVGELAILAHQPRSASVQALGGSARVLVVEGKAFQAILRDRPQVCTAMLANLARRLSTMD